MDRMLRYTDFATMTGIISAIGGILLCLFLLFVPVTIGATVPDPVAGGSVDLRVSMRWIQPILGQAIVEDALIKYHYGRDISDAIKVSDRAALAAQLLNGGSTQTQASVYAGTIGADHDARVQWVMGRLIVELTRHSVRAGMVTGDRLAEEENHRIMTIAQETRKKMDDGFRSEWQAKLGRGIASQMLSQVPSEKHGRERVGLIF